VKVKIINIQPNIPPYEYLSASERPEQFWKKPKGSWLGFWTREWPDLLGEAVLKTSDQYDWEVWQPDYRADKIYSKQLNTGVIHKLFPAQEKAYRSGVSSQKGTYSSEMISRLSDIGRMPIILQLHGFPSLLNLELIRILGPTRKFPILLVTHGTVMVPLKELFGLCRPFTYLKLLIQQWNYYRILQYIDIIGCQNQISLNNVRMMYSGRVEKLHLGCDFNFWTPVPSQEAKKTVRKKLGIPDNQIVFLATGNFVPLKQFDKLIKTFKKLSYRSDLLLIIVGHGNKTNTDYLHSLIRKLVLKNKVIFLHYLTGKALRDLYWTSDVYISVSRSEGSSVAVMKAMACGLPIITTSVGETAERMKKHGVGKIIPVKSCNKWTNVILEILSKEIPKALDIEIARAAYDWPNIAKRFINIYDDLVNLYKKPL